ncbi:gliding motility-associated C-terminal domain-containing protein [Neptunitalea lumnitzerae]|uniref:Fibronectin type-III domain-containing protein n=1 Tax=Neptunitalea lumnitzerae TaxID=2965509 RepID=A0ABQ5MPC4_9FLAO|nr:gliding motility-associated C-terminal domain-containing protein [Neptunitalea sp. Y10]GLB50960.1 hypothetical protein Y10_33280 [Neptunitalea sp. Y10]
MRKLLLLICFLVVHYINGQTYEVLSVTSGYNEDVIANGSGSAASSTSNILDDDSYALMAADFNPGTGTTPTNGLVAGGFYSSPNITGLSFQLADYSANNSLRLGSTVTNGTLVFSNQVNATNLYLLTTSGSGSSVITVDIQFTDGTTQTATANTVPDWFNSTALPVEVTGVGRVNVNTDGISNLSNNPRLYRLSIPIDVTNQTKLIGSVLITRNSGGIANIFAASAQLLDACPAPDNITSSGITNSDAILSWDAPAVAPTSYDYYYSTTNTAPTGSTTPSGNTTNTSTTLTGLTATTSYYFWVRSVCSGTDVSNWTGPYAFDTAMCPVSDQCTYTFNMTDTFGDGWNGNTMDIMQNGVVIETITLNSGSSGSTSIGLCNNAPFTIHWNSGSWTNEVGMTVVNDYGSQVEFTLPSGSGSLAGSDIYTGNVYCAPITCPQPTALSVANITSTEADLSWTAGGAETEWQVIVVPAGSSITGVTGTTTTTIPYTVTGLNPLTEYDFYVLAVCGPADLSFTSGPESFTTSAANDECEGAIDVPVNTDDTCTQITPVTFTGATPSTTSDSCSTNNNGDLWYSFIATSTVHEIEMMDPISDSGSLEGNFDDVVLTLYEGSCGSLAELYCTTVNNILQTDLVVGQVYYIKITDNTTASYNTQFDLCINIPSLPANQDSFNCAIRTINSDFELPVVSGIYPPQVSHNLVQGWRTTATDGLIEIWPTPNFESVPSYSGNQFIELNATNTSLDQGVYQDYQTPAATTFTYSFAHRARRPGGFDECKLLSGPPGGPYVEVGTFQADDSAWVLNTGTHTTPSAQPVTRFIFQASQTVTGDPSIGNFLDAVSFTADNSITVANPLTIDCDDTNAVVTAAGGGFWSAVDSTDGTVIADPTSNSTTISGFDAPGSYFYEWNGTYCSDVLEIIYDVYVVEFDYDTPEVCYNEANIIPTLAADFSMGGTFTSDAGLVIDETTGEISVAQSTPGTYTVTYALPPATNTNCDTEYSVDITIYAPVEVAFVGGCEGLNNYVLTAEPTNITDLTGVTFEWTAPDGSMAGSSQSITATMVGDYVVTITSADGCISDSTIAVESIFCDIPQGISPNASAGLNDNFDLTGLNVERIQMFNRLGTEIYTYTNYTDEWHGQDKNGNILPVGTYFYVLYFSDGNKTRTGWVYLNY